MTRFQILYETCDGFLPGPPLTWDELLGVIRDHRQLSNPCRIRAKAAA